jgi:uncharacterized protein (TIGR03067 family)
MRFLVVTILLVAGMTVYAAEGKGDLDKLQGTWARVSEVKDGKASPEEAVKKTKLTIKGDKYTLRMGDDKRSGTLKVDASKSPATIDIMSEDGPNKGKTLQGIYKVEGDTLTYCIAPPGRERPTAFESKSGSGVMLYVNKREK